MRTRRGFTLIELLVVIAIIAILAAILFPVFISAKEKANAIKCMAHGRQIGEATMMYMADNGDRFPSGIRAYPSWQKSGSDWAPVPGTSADDALKYLQSFTWTYTWDPKVPDEVWDASKQAQWRYIQLRRYTKNEDMWICPSPTAMYAKRYAYGARCSWLPRSSDGSPDVLGFVDGDRGFEMAGDPCPSGPGSVGLTVSQVQDLDRQGKSACGARYMPPSKKIMWMCYAFGTLGRTLISPDGTGAYPYIFPSYPHQGGSTFVYADGHAAWQRVGTGWAPIGYTNLDMDQHQ